MLYISEVMGILFKEETRMLKTGAANLWISDGVKETGLSMPVTNTHGNLAGLRTISLIMSEI